MIFTVSGVTAVRYGHGFMSTIVVSLGLDQFKTGKHMSGLMITFPAARSIARLSTDMDYKIV